MMISNIQDVRDLMVEAAGIEATYGPNAYSDYLVRHGCRPDPDTAATMGAFMGGRVRANDGRIYPCRKAKT